ncbi:hypothetical protein GCM10010428_24170 [Actinosynnema pretiosum subsp. pretiosum]
MGAVPADRWSSAQPISAVRSASMTLTGAITAVTWTRSSATFTPSGDHTTPATPPELPRPQVPRTADTTTARRALR